MYNLARIMCRTLAEALRTRCLAAYLTTAVKSRETVELGSELLKQTLSSDMDVYEREGERAASACPWVVAVA